MTNWTWWKHNDSHPSERDLLLTVNGEGGVRLARRVRDHVEGCWSCSLKRDRLAGAIGAFMRERENGLGAEDLSETADRRFESRLRRLAQQVESRSPSRPRPGRRPLAFHPQTAVALSLMAAFAALIWLRFSSVPSVSAREVLNRAERAEARRIEGVHEPVIHQQFQLTRLANGLTPESTDLEIWHDLKSNRWRQESEEAAAVPGVANLKSVAAKNKSRKTVRADRPLVAEFQEILKTNEMHQQPISVSAFAGWRSKLRSPEERVTETSLENGDKALTIATSAPEPLPRHAIAKNEIVIRLKDWHPVQQRLSISEPDGFRSYDIRETSFEVVALSSLGASIFEQPVLPAAVALQTSSPDRLAISENLNDALELEITLLHRLHQAGVCLEEVQVVRGASGKPEVRGVADTVEKKQELTRLFAEFPGVPVVLQGPGGDEKAESTVDSGASAVPITAETGPGSDTGLSPLKDQLMAHFARLDIPAEARRARMVEYSNQVISLSQSAYQHAWELRRLVDRANKMTLENASPSAQAKFRDIVQDHLGTLTRIVGRCDEMLRPVIASLANTQAMENHAAASSDAQEGNWQSRSMRVFDSVMTADRLIHGLLAGTETMGNLPESSTALLTSFPRILEDARAAESKLSNLVSVPGPQLMSPQPIQQATRQD